MQKQILFFISIFFFLGITAQDKYRAVHFGIDEGLGKERWHTAIIKDVNGFLWFGTNYGELSRFDGFNFKRYDPDKNKAGSISSNNCFNFVEDSLHNIWIGTFKGLSRYDIKADTFTNFKAFVNSAGLPDIVVPFWASSVEIFCIENNSWISSYNVYTFERKKLFDLKEIAQSDKVQIHPPAVFDSLSNSVWMLLSNKEGLVQLSLTTHKSTFYYRDDNKIYRGNLIHKDAEAMCFDRNRNCFWINSHDGLVQFSLSDTQFHYIDAMNPLIKLKDYDRWVGIDIDRMGRIWLATIPKGIIMYDPATKIVIDPLSDTTLQKEVAGGNLKIYCDRDGMVWTSYWSAGGIYQLIPFAPAVHRYMASATKPDSLTSLGIANMVSGEHGSLWIGTDEGLNIIDHETGSVNVLREKDLPGIKGKGIVPMFIDTLRKKAWLNASPPDKVYEMDINTKKCKAVIFKDTANRIISPVNIINNTARPYKDGFLFLDAGHGIFEVTGDNQVARLVIPIPGAFIIRMTIAEDKKLYLNPDHITYYNISGKWIKTAHPMDSIDWTDIYYDKADQTYWVGVSRELIHYDKDFQKIRSYTDEEGLIGEPLTILPDGRGNIWFNNDRKIIGILNIKTGTVFSLSEQDGYKKQSYDWTSPQAKAAGGELYFPGNPLAPGKIGLDRVSPDKFGNAPPSLVYIKSLKINQKDFQLSTGVNNLQELSLRYFENKISIETGVINFYSMGKSHIRYKLEVEGRNAAWEYAPSYYTIRYEDLPPGKYRLVMQASNASNEFNGPEKSLTILISPPWWKTWWAFLLYVMGFSFLLWGFIQFRSRNLKQKNIELEDKVMLRTKELKHSLEELKDTQAQLIQSEKMASLGELTAGIAHEIQNPLNFVNNFSDINAELIEELKTEAQEGNNKEVIAIANDIKANEEKINHHGKRADAIVKGMLLHSRSSSGIKEPTDINKLADEYLRLAYHGLRAKDKSFNATMKTDFDEKIGNINIIPQDIGRVILNLINNAFYAVDEKKKQIPPPPEGEIKALKNEYEPIVTVKTSLTPASGSKGPQVIISVGDNGNGIPQKVIDKIFQPFFTTKPSGQGTGLGLSLSYDIVKTHGGELRVETKENEGSEFIISLPI